MTRRLVAANAIIIVMRMKLRSYGLSVSIAIGLLIPVGASANLLKSTNFRLDPNVANTFGGLGTSPSYKLTDSGGEAAVGAGSSSSYRLTQGYVAQLVHSLSLSVMPSGTYAYWPLDTGNGTQAFDVSMTGDLGNLQAAPTWGVGKIGQALTFNGSTQYVSSTTTQSGPNAMTEEMWFKTTTTSGGRLMGFGSSSTGASASLDRHVYMSNGGQLVFGVNNGTQKTISSAATYNDGAWHHVAVTLGALGMTMVIDGIRAGTDGTVTTGGAYTGYWRMAYDNLAGWPSAPTSSFFAGSLDEVRVYSRQLTDAEIKGDYIAGQSGLQFAHTLPNVTPGTSSTFGSDAVVRTDAGGYNLFIQATSLLTHTDTTTTIPMMAGTVAAPATWTEGTTKGLGFTVTSGTQVEAKWVGSPYNYAGIPLSAMGFHARTGLNGGIPEVTRVQFRADTDASQKQGSYTTNVTYTATLKP